MFSQTSEDTTFMWFKYIYKVDKTYTQKQFIRSQIYINNFNIINNELKKGVLKKSAISGYNKKTNAAIKYGMDLTFIHILKTNPALILNVEYINFIENEIINNDFDEELLVMALNFYYYNLTYYQSDPPKKNENPFAKHMSHQYDDLLYEAIKRWGIEETVKNYK